MLQQILKDMFIDPELLAELSEHQKELLFVKMREEQVRRWKVRDEEEMKKPVKNRPKKGKNVCWLQGRDGCEWVWVMGEHADDVTIEEILEREQKEKARIQAEEEASEKRVQENNSFVEEEEGQISACEPQRAADIIIKREQEEMRKKEQEELEKQRLLKEEEEKLKRENEALELERKKAEAAAYASLKELRLQKEKVAREEAEKKRKEEELRRKQEQLRREHEQKEKERKEREERLRKEELARSEELYMSLKKIREEQKKAAMKEREQADIVFQVQLRESKKADTDRRFRAKLAREEIRRSRISKDMSNVNISEAILNKQIIPPEKPTDMDKQQPPLPQRKRQAPRPPKPTGHKSVVEWFQQEEAQRNAGLIKETKKIAPWFHGIITRQQAEYHLYPLAPGHFLVRVSERIWGYALSFRDKDRAKHFLIDASGSTYSFFGQDQKSHASLEDLVNFHMRQPISELGKEILVTPCGQASDKPPDYEELFSNLSNQDTTF